MTTTAPVDPEILLVGSVPLRDTDEVINTVYAELGQHLRRIPDGETGERANWILWQYPALEAHPALEPDPDLPPYPVTTEKGGLVREIPLLRFREGVDPETVAFEPGYAEAAKSYVSFAGLKRTGRLRPDLRFQVCLPTAVGVASHFISPRSQAAFAAAYERALLEELRIIVNAIPHPELAIQWDAVYEVLYWAGRRAWWGTDARAETLAALTRLGSAVPEAVELGFHLCYGDPGGHHLVEPTDCAVLVALANGIAASIERPVQWLHLPVPVERSDVGYFEPLAGLRLPPHTRLVLGLIHASDGEAGNAARIAAAREVVSDFGLATECGWGRRDPESIPELLRLHLAAAASMQ